MRVKLLERDDIRRFGGTVVDIPDHIAQSLIERWRAVKVGDGHNAPVTGKEGVAKDKQIWIPPEDKAMQMAKSILAQERKPKVSDALFPKTIIA